jgi:hypothetical protein
VTAGDAHEHVAAAGASAPGVDATVGVRPRFVATYSAMVIGRRGGDADCRIDPMLRLI